MMPVRVLLRSNMKRIKLLPKTCHNHVIKIYMYLCIGKFVWDFKKKKKNESSGNRRHSWKYDPVQQKKSTYSEVEKN